MNSTDHTPTLYKEQVTTEFLQKWQEMTDLLAALINVPAVLIMRYEQSSLEVFLSSNSPGNPYHVGEKSHWSGLYCKTVVESGEYLMIPNALKDPLWENNPDIRLGMIAYLGYPVNYPDGTPFGTLCVLDRNETHFSEQTVNLLRHFRNTIQTDLSVLLNRKLSTTALDSILVKSESPSDSEYRKNSAGTEFHSDAFFYYLYSHISDSIFYIDSSTQRFVAANKAAQEIYGYTEEEFTKLTLEDIDYEYDSSRVKWLTDELTRNGKGVFEVIHKTKTGELLEVEVKIVLLENKIILALARDITKRKIVERRLNELNNTKDVFLNLLSHDLKGSMNVILNYTELIVSKNNILQPHQKVEYCREVHKSALLTNRLLDNLLLWTELKSGKVPVKTEVFQAKDCISDIYHVLKPEMDEHSILFCDRETSDVWIKGDSGIFSKTIRLLIGNAIQYSPTGGEVKVVLCAEDGFVRVDVCDQGRGLLPEFLDLIFTIEHLIHYNTHLNDPATGLSLVVCRELVELNGGTIRAICEPGKGTIMRFTVPLASEQEIVNIYSEIKRETH